VVLQCTKLRHVEIEALCVPFEGDAMVLHIEVLAMVPVVQQALGLQRDE
jgi:hypothetical protein